MVIGIGVESKVEPTSPTVGKVIEVQPTDALVQGPVVAAESSGVGRRHSHAERPHGGRTRARTVGREVAVGGTGDEGQRHDDDRPEDDQGAVPVPGHHGSEGHAGPSRPRPELSEVAVSVGVDGGDRVAPATGPQVAVEVVVPVLLTGTPVQMAVAPSLKVTVPVGLLGTGS